jgi:hypothetical protein
MGVIAGLVIATAAGTARFEEGTITLSVQPDAILIVFAVGTSFAIGLRQGGSAFLRHWMGYCQELWIGRWRSRDGLRLSRSIWVGSPTVA